MLTGCVDPLNLHVIYFAISRHVMHRVCVN